VSPMLADDTLEVMSYNIRRKGDDPQKFQWDNRKQLVFDLISSKKPAIIGFQEVTKEQFEDLKKALVGYKSFGEPRHKYAGPLQWLVSWHPDAKDEYNPIFYDPKKVTLVTSGTFGINPILSLHPLSRTCTWGEFENNQTTKYFNIYNTHLDNKWKKTRDQQMDMVISYALKKTFLQSASAHLSNPTIIMGDMNTKIEGPIKEILTKEGFQQGREIAALTKGPKETRTGWDDKELKEIDHILGKDIEVTEYEVVKSPDGVYPSDHRPVIAKIKLPNPPFKVNIGTN